MKIGIMSMQRVANYGSYLQAYGLKKTLENLGHEVQFVDYKREGSLIKEEAHSLLNNLVKKVAKIFRILSPKYRKWREKQIRMNESFGVFVQTYSDVFLPTLGVGKQRSECPELDVLVIGSDEVFNCTQAGDMVGYSKQLFGKEHCANKLLSYAASFGSTTLEKLENHDIAKEIADCLAEFDAISVRDENSWNIVDELIKHNAERHIDPVLLYDFPEVEGIKITEKDYVIVYAYSGRISDKEALVIRKFAKENGKKILCLGFYQPFCDEYVLASPLEVLAYVKNADYVITDTFHGTVFSIKYQVPFATIIRESNKQKLGDLLSLFQLQSRQLINIDDLVNVIELPLDRSEIQEKIACQQKNAYEYLKRETII